MTQRSSNYSKVRTVTYGGVDQEEVCRVCRGTGEDPHRDGADCITCWGEGTIPLEGEESLDGGVGHWDAVNSK